MDYRRFGSTIFARIDRGEEVLEQIRAICAAEKVTLGHITALGATEDFTIGVYDLESQSYRMQHITTFHEILSINGTVNTMNGEHYCHVHITAADTNGRAVGGHLNRCVIGITCELVLTVVEGMVDRKRNEALGFNMMEFV